MQTIMKSLYGSHLYGTNTADSDLDYKGVFLPETANTEWVDNFLYENYEKVIRSS